jgi:hypothetical protein
MKKLSLKLDELLVESFDTTASPRRRGTAFAYDSDTGQPCANTEAGHTCDTTCYQIDCGCTGYNGTCDVSCNGTCNGQGDTCVYGCATYLGCPSVYPYHGC